MSNSLRLVDLYRTIKHIIEGGKKKTITQTYQKLLLVVPLINHFDNTSTPMVFHSSDIMLLQHIHIKRYIIYRKFIVVYFDGRNK